MATVTIKIDTKGLHVMAEALRHLTRVGIPRAMAALRS
jgi:hypothetical protein